MDRRIIRTKKAIKDAFFTLITKKEIEHISIKDIADEANISRKTFYYYYEGIWSVIDECWNDFLENLEETLRDISFKGDMTVFSNITYKISDIISKDVELYKAIFKVQSVSIINENITASLKEKFMDYFYKDISKYPRDYDLSMEFIFSGMIRAYKQWLFKENREPIEEFTEKVNMLIFKGMEGFVSNTK